MPQKGQTDADDPGYEVLPEVEGRREPIPTVVRRPVAGWVRVTLLLMAAGFVTVFAIALWLKPYSPDGRPLRMATHTQLGLPECNMVLMTGKPCPACGLTTSFALLMHGDLPASIQANWVGTVMAGYWLVLIPWAVFSAIRGHLLGVRSGEALLTWSVGVFLALMLVRWVIVLWRG